MSWSNLHFMHGTQACGRLYMRSVCHCLDSVLDSRCRTRHNICTDRSSFYVAVSFIIYYYCFKYHHYYEHHHHAITCTGVTTSVILVNWVVCHQHSLYMQLPDSPSQIERLCTEGMKGSDIWDLYRKSGHYLTLQWCVKMQISKDVDLPAPRKDRRTTIRHAAANIPTKHSTAPPGRGGNQICARGGRTVRSTFSH